VKAVLARAFGPPESLRIEEVNPRDVGPDDVRIAVRAAGVSFVDGLIAAGLYQIKPPLPFTPGTEFAGVVDAVGERVTSLRVGDRVCTSAIGGGFAEQAVVPARAALAFPDAMTFGEAAIFRVSYATALHALVQRGRLQAGETVLVLGAGGAVGAAAVQVAKALGGRVIASASSEAKRQVARRLGADESLDSRAPDWREQVKALCGGDGPDIVVDPVGGAMSEAAFRSLAWGGRHLVIGFASGEIPRLPANLPLLKGAAVVGVDVRLFGERAPREAAANAQTLFELQAAGAVTPFIAARYPFASFAEAMRTVSDGDTAGRVVLEFP